MKIYFVVNIFHVPSIIGEVSVKIYFVVNIFQVPSIIGEV